MKLSPVLAAVVLLLSGCLSTRPAYYESLEEPQAIPDPEPSASPESGLGSPEEILIREFQDDGTIRESLFDRDGEPDDYKILTTDEQNRIIREEEYNRKGERKNTKLTTYEPGRIIRSYYKEETLYRKVILFLDEDGRIIREEDYRL